MASSPLQLPAGEAPLLAEALHTYGVDARPNKHQLRRRNISQLQL